jgi:uncharacterized membrane protein
MEQSTPHRRDEYLTHRLQAFSDIVIGFSLAQLTLSLVVPNRAADLWSHPTWLVAYLWTFGVIAAIWSGHTRLFRYIFVPTPVNVVVNFVMLASLGLTVYFLQLYMRLTKHIADVLIIGRSYFTAFGIMLVCFGVMYVISLRHEPESISARDLQKGRRTRARTFCIGIGTLCGVGASFIVAKEFALLAIVAGLLAGAIAFRVLAARSGRGANRRALSQDMP